jgi:pimeloyl-ACP methyl ester carboxylesterase
MAAFVLVHGAWVGDLYWRNVARRLRSAGHEVYAPSLTGMGARSHLLSRGTDLDLHVQDVVNLVTYEDLREIVLVGHSYGGSVITGVAELCAERIVHLVYLDAFVPADCQAVLDLGTPQRMAWVRDQVASAGYGWLIPCPPLDSFGPIDPLLTANLQPGPQPFATFEQPVRLSNRAAAALPRTFIRCSAYPGFELQADRVRSKPGWEYREIPTSHFAPLTEPDRVCELLLEAAGWPPESKPAGS